MAAAARGAKTLVNARVVRLGARQGFGGGGGLRVSRAFRVSAVVVAASNIGEAASHGHERDARPQVAVLGGGAAGLTAAYFAASAGARVTIYERTSETGKKILMSGGARCNVLPVSMRIEDFVTESAPRHLKAVLASWSVERCREWLERDVELALGIEHVTNKYFPLSNSSREVRDKLVQACLRVGVKIQYDTTVESLRPVDGGKGWALRIKNRVEEHVPVVILGACV